jgi:hypothetical protein
MDKSYIICALMGGMSNKNSVMFPLPVLVLGQCHFIVPDSRVSLILVIFVLIILPCFLNISFCMLVMYCIETFVNDRLISIYCSFYDLCDASDSNRTPRYVGSSLGLSHASRTAAILASLFHCFLLVSEEILSTHPDP